MAIIELLGFETEPGTCTITGTQQMYVSTTVRAEFPGNEFINTFKIHVLNAQGQCVKAFEYKGVVLINNFYDWRSPWFSLPAGKYTLNLVAHSITVGPTTPRAIDGETLVQTTC